jgi:formylglycine-generating enzyme required for sulfatase activity
MILRDLFRELVSRCGPGVLRERWRLVGLLLDRGHCREARLVEAAFDAGVVDTLLNHPGWFKRVQVWRRLQDIGLRADAALAIVEAFGDCDHVNRRLWWRLKVLAGATLLALPSLALVFVNPPTGWQSQRLRDLQADIERMQMEFSQRMAEAEAMRNTLQVEIAGPNIDARTGTEPPPIEIDSTNASSGIVPPVLLNDAGGSDETKEDPDPKHTLSLPAMTEIAGGCFQMGTAARQWVYAENEKPHRVCVKPFKLARFEVTQAQWQAVMQANPSHFAECGLNCPVEGVSFVEVQAFIVRLNAMTGQQYRLPTEAEWKYACRAGTTQLYCGSNDLAAVAWYEGNSDGRTHPVGLRQANSWGLYDMTGNVAEWTCSNYARIYNGREARCATQANAWRVTRGGSWSDGIAVRDEGIYNPLRSTSRQWGYPEDIIVLFHYGSLGFRLARN